MSSDTRINHTAVVQSEQDKSMTDILWISTGRKSLTLESCFRRAEQDDNSVEETLSPQIFHLILTG